jgi:hypothetical protein
MIRDDEIQRLIRYAEGLGVKVKFLKKVRGSDAAAWVVDGSEILIYTNSRTSKIDIVLSLVHEIGHHVWFIHEKNRKPDLKFEEALERQNLYECDLSGTPAPKKQRKKILDAEIAGTQWWDIIYKDTNLSFSKWKLEANKEFDIYVYTEYYLTGHFPSKKLGREKYKEILRKYKK